MSDRLKGAVFLAVGIALLVAAGFVAVSTRDFLQRSRLAAGLVIAEPYGPHHVKVRFRTARGEVVTYHQNGEVTLHTGEAVQVRYDPAAPRRDSCVDRFGAIWGTTGFLGLMGGVFALSSVAAAAAAGVAISDARGVYVSNPTSTPIWRQRAMKSQPRSDQRPPCSVASRFL